MKGSTRDFTYTIGMVNMMRIWNNIGLSFGINIFRNHHYHFNDDDEIYIENSWWYLQPSLSIDILDIRNPFKKSDD